MDEYIGRYFTAPPHNRYHLYKIERLSGNRIGFSYINKENKKTYATDYDEKDLIKYLLKEKVWIFATETEVILYGQSL